MSSPLSPEATKVLPAGSASSGPEDTVPLPQNPYAYYDGDGHLVTGILRLTQEQADKLGLCQTSEGVEFFLDDAFPISFRGNKDISLIQALEQINNG